MEFAPDCHTTGDLLERYAMGRLTGQELEELEQHLLICYECQDRLALEDAFAQGVRAAAPAAQNLPPEHHWWTLPKPVWALGLAALGLAAFWLPNLHRTAAPPAVVWLQATRGPQDPGLAAAPAGKPITLALDLRDLPRFDGYRLEVVDLSGRSLFQSKADAQNNQVRATVAHGLSAGAYFVRLYAPNGELLREYALTLHR